MLYCCCCLDKTAAKPLDLSPKGHRWNFLQGESLHGTASGEPKSSGSAASRIYRRKLQEKLKQPLYGVSWSSTVVLSGGNKPNSFIRNRTKFDVEMTEEKISSSRYLIGQPICSCNVAARVAKNLISFLVVIGTSGAHEETFMLTCKVLARLMGASRQGPHLAQITDQQQLTTLLRLAVHGKKSSQLLLNHAIYCFLVDCLKWNKNQVNMTSTATMFAPRYESTRSTPDLEPVSVGSSTNGTPVLTKKKMAAAPPRMLQFALSPLETFQ